MLSSVYTTVRIATLAAPRVRVASSLHSRAAVKESDEKTCRDADVELGSALRTVERMMKALAPTDATMCRISINFETDPLTKKMSDEEIGAALRNSITQSIKRINASELTEIMRRDPN